MTRVHILAPVHNRRSITEGFVGCLKAQTYGNFGLILIDDGGTDGTADLVRSYLPATTVLRGDGSLWWAGSLQRALDFLKGGVARHGDIALIMNDDTRFEPDFIEKGVTALLGSKDSLLLAQLYDAADGRLLETGVTVNWKELQFRPANKPDEVNCLSTRGLFLRFEDMLKIGGFWPTLLPHYASDYEYTLRARRKGFRFLTSPEVKLWGYEDEYTTGIRSMNGMSIGQFLGAIFTKRALHNPFYWTTFVLLSCPWRYVPVNLLRVWRSFFWQARVALSTRRRIGRIAGAIRRRVQAPANRWKAAHELRRTIRRNGAPLRIIIGASGTQYSGWLPTEYPLVNIADWLTLRRFFEPESVSAILAEHVWEHLTPVQAEAAARNCRELLAVGGHLRVAVPDGLHPDSAYIEYVRPGGSGEGSDDHKVLYTYRSLSELFERAGFSTRLLEWFDENGRFHSTAWDPEGGHVTRSTRFDERNHANPTAYTSIILDAVKTA